MRVLFPVDGRARTEAALDRGLGMLRSVPGLRVTLLNVMQAGFDKAGDPAYVEETFGADEEDQIFPTEESARRALDRAAAIARKHRVAAEPVVAEGNYVQAILEAAKGHDLLMMHALGPSSLRDSLRGSHAEDIARKAPCAVMLVPEA